MDSFVYKGTDNLEAMTHAVNYNKFLIAQVKKQAQNDDLILDFGAGIGTFANEVSKAGYQVICVEPDLKQASFAHSLDLVVVNNLQPIEDISCDYIYSLNVLEHIEDDVALLKQLFKKIKPGGRLFIYVPAFQLLFSKMDVKVGHYRRYTRKTLTHAVKKAGFQVLQSQYADSIGFFITILYKILGNNNGDINRRALFIYDRFIFPLSKLLDKFLACFIGKNVMITAIKPR